MTLAQQVCILLEAANDQLLQPEDIVRWADEAIAATEHPPIWLIELSILGSPHIQDYISRLSSQCQGRISIRRHIEIVILAHNSGLLSFADTISLLFRVVILERDGRSIDTLGERLSEALINWDCQEDSDVIGPVLRARFEALFQEALQTTHEIADVLHWNFRDKPDVNGAGN